MSRIINVYENLVIQRRRSGPMTCMSLAERFITICGRIPWEEDTDECIECFTCLNTRTGRPHLIFNKPQRDFFNLPNTTLAHRISYMIADDGRWIPEGLYCCHHCDNVVCVNWKHLFLGTQKDNMQDMVSKGRENRTPSPGTIGSKHPISKLKEEDIPLIREYCQEYTIASIARHFGVTPGAIIKIRDGKAWKHIK